MTMQKRLELMVKGNLTSAIPKHCKLAAQVLEDLKRTLEANQIYVLDELNWPYHIGVEDIDGRLISLYCGGFRQLIEIQKLRKDGMADTRYKEVTFYTPLGATHYIRGLLRR